MIKLPLEMKSRWLKQGENDERIGCLERDKWGREWM